MTGFDDIHLDWRGQRYTVPANGVLLLIYKIELSIDPANGNALGVLLRPSGPSLSRLAAAYGAALRHAGAVVTDDEVYIGIVSGAADGGAGVQEQIQGAIMGLLHIVAPPVASKMVQIMNAQGDDSAAGEASPAGA
jgi:hypothetical protein